jgi:hypothetical protein
MQGFYRQNAGDPLAQLSKVLRNRVGPKWAARISTVHNSPGENLAGDRLYEAPAARAVLIPAQTRPIVDGR